MRAEWQWPIVAIVATFILTLTARPTRADEPPVSVKKAPEGTAGSAAEAAEKLRPPGSDSRYKPKVDWRTVPPWQQTSFFGIRAQGKTFIYVVDCSGSMGEGGRLIRAKRELRKSITNLRFPQRFQVIFYNDRPLPMPGGIPESADLPNKSRMQSWLNLIDAEGETDPRGALAQAIGMRPDAIFLLSDGEFPEGTVEAVAKQNKNKVPIHCVDLGGGAGADQLARIARDSGGEYTSQP